MVCSVKVVNHVCARLLISMVEDVVFWVHLPLYLVHLVGPEGSVFGHDDCTLEFSGNEILIKSLKSILY
jgi:hypothetical protein